MTSVNVDVPRGGGGVQRRGCHTGLNVLSQSRLEVSRCRWMCRASIVFLLEWLVSTCLTVAARRSCQEACVRVFEGERVVRD